MFMFQWENLPAIAGFSSHKASEGTSYFPADAGLDDWFRQFLWPFRKIVLHQSLIQCLTKLK